jgi:hypothetical protein
VNPQKNENFIRQSLDNIVLEAKNLAFKSVSSAKHASDPDTASAVELFKSKAETLRSKYPALYENSLVALEKMLQTEAVSHDFFRKAARFLADCAAEGTETVDSCLSKSKEVWSKSVASNELGDDKASQQADVYNKLLRVAEEARALIQALSTFQLCSAAKEAADLAKCIADAKAVCLDGECLDTVENAASDNVVKQCEKHTSRSFNYSSALLLEFWELDKSGAWLSSSELLDDVVLSFQNSACSVRNSTRALDIRDQTLKNLVKVSMARSHLAGLVTTCGICAAVLVGSVLLSFRFVFVDQKSTYHRDLRMKVTIKRFYLNVV